MLVSKQSKHQIRNQNIAFVLLFLSVVILLAWLSVRYPMQADWTVGNRNTLSVASVELLKVVQGQIKITAYVNQEESLRRLIGDLVARYQKFKKDIELVFFNPETDPNLIRELGINVNGELIIEFDGRKEHLKELSEQSLTNALQRILRNNERWIVFLKGHGERDPFGDANHDLQGWAQEMEIKGFKVQAVNLADTPSIPKNTAVLVLAGAQVDLLPGEVKMIEQYVNTGGNFLWLAEPGPQHGMDPVAELLGVEFNEGVIVDPSTQLLGINDPRFALVSEYPFHPITQNFNVLTLFPQAASIEVDESERWQVTTLLETLDRSWVESGEIGGNIKFDKGKDLPGPLKIGVVLTRALEETDKEVLKKGEKAQSKDAQMSEEEGGGESAGISQNPMERENDSDGDGENEQRVIVVGDGDFLSNTYLGNGGNLDLGMSIINWLGHDDALISIPAKIAPDTNLNLSKNTQIAIYVGFLILLPLALIGSGVSIWLNRRKQ